MNLCSAHCSTLFQPHGDSVVPNQVAVLQSQVDLTIITSFAFSYGVMNKILMKYSHMPFTYRPVLYQFCKINITINPQPTCSTSHLLSPPNRKRWKRKGDLNTIILITIAVVRRTLIRHYLFPRMKVGVQSENISALFMWRYCQQSLWPNYSYSDVILVGLVSPVCSTATPKLVI